MQNFHETDDVVDSTVVDAESTEATTISDSASVGASELLDDTSPLDSARTTEEITQTLPPRKHRVSDANEEKLLTANAALTLLFDVMDSMDARNIMPEEVTYRMVMEICSKCGNAGRATQLMERMARANVVPDSSLMRMLVCAFATERTSALQNMASVDYNWETVWIMLSFVLCIVYFYRMAFCTSDSTHAANVRSKRNEEQSA